MCFFFKQKTAYDIEYGLVGSEMGIRDRLSIAQNEAAGSLTSFELLADIAVDFSLRHGIDIRDPLTSKHPWYVLMELSSSRDDARACLLYTSDAADERSSVDLGGRRITKKKKKQRSSAVRLWAKAS